MLIIGIRVDNDVVDVYEYVAQSMEDLLHKSLECRWCDPESERHSDKLV